MPFAPVEGRAVVADFDGGAITSDAGALLLGATDRAIGLVEGFAGGFSDGRDPERVVHDLATLVGQRIFAIAMGSPLAGPASGEDLVEHDARRFDPGRGVVLERLPTPRSKLRGDPVEAKHGRCAPLAGMSMPNRLEHGTAAAIEDLFVELCLDALAKPPQAIALDEDV
ncbi:MAG: transposase [Alphaproteobacteria bacterium]